MAVVLVAVGFFGAAALMLSLGVILKKRTPLKGSCHGPGSGQNGERSADHRVCTSCECAKVPARH